MPTFTIARSLRLGPTRFPAGANGQAVPSGASNVEVVLDIAQADLDNPSVTFTVGLYRIQNGGTPTPIAGPTTFVGGPNKGKSGGPTTPPSYSASVSQLAGVAGAGVALIADFPAPGVQAGATINVT